ncbi:MAG: alpha/beta hydrolase [Candidatus Hydrogenedentes bacterium]|nr:alpha/beta hydrolase [Candidatus Hydrogenedentota bacterium]
MPSFAFQSTKWTLDIATRLIQADIRLHNAEVIKDDQAIIFVVNHFTRLETLLLPYVLHKQTDKVIWSLAAADLFVGRIGSYLRSAGNLSTKDPDRDKTIIHSLLKGDNPWIIFPEGQMIKDKKVVDHRGLFRVYNSGKRRPPHTGAAALALRAEFYRHKLECLRDDPHHRDQLAAVLERFGLTSMDETLRKRTVIIPVNITYYPIRARENILLRLARGLAKDLSERAIEELSVEGTLLSSDSNIDITLGEPIDVRNYLDAPQYAPLMACGEWDMQALEENPLSLFNDAARELMLRYMADIYRLTTINYDHVFATLIRYQRARRFTERSLRNRVFLCVRQIRDLGYHRMHTLLESTYQDILYEDPSPKFQEFLDLCLQEGFIRKEGRYYYKSAGALRNHTDFHQIRQRELTYVIANEVEPLRSLTQLIHRLANMPRPELSKAIREIFLREDKEIFEADYAKHYREGESKPVNVGQPFLLCPERPKAGMVLVHGYLAAPLEVRAMAWEDWYESFNRGYAIIKSLTDTIVLGGFSTGGGLALLGAARKQGNIRAVFSINAPLQLRRYAARWAPSLAAVNTWLGKVRNTGGPWEFVENRPENPAINYTRNPLSGVGQLAQMMDVVEDSLKDICVPAFILHGARDPIVDAASGEMLFSKVGTPLKEFTMLERDRHGIINGAGAQDVFEHVHRFLLWAESKTLGTEARIGQLPK